MSGSENTNSNKCVNENQKSCCDVMYIDKCKYIVNSHFSEKKSAETVTQKIEKLILNEALKNI